MALNALALIFATIRQSVGLKGFNATIPNYLDTQKIMYWFAVHYVKTNHNV